MAALRHGGAADGDRAPEQRSPREVSRQAWHQNAPHNLGLRTLFCYLEAVAQPHRRPFLDGDPQPDGYHATVAGRRVTRLGFHIDAPEEARIEDTGARPQQVFRPERRVDRQTEGPDDDVRVDRTIAGHDDLAQ